uniref:Chromosome 1 open reading frame 94 n=1 Tax=Pavo cristatus TaxID=9049 RepID=A0A8C9FAJ6_PAVCR
MKLRALCDAQLSAKSTITNLLHSASTPRGSKGLGDSSTTGAGSKLGMPLLLKHTDIAKGPDRQVMAEESKAVREFLQNGMFSTAKNSTAVPALPAESQTAGQKQQLSTVAKICSRPDSNALILSIPKLHFIPDANQYWHLSLSLFSIQCPPHVNKQGIQEGHNHRVVWGGWLCFRCHDFGFPEMFKRSTFPQSIDNLRHLSISEWRKIMVHFQILTTAVLDKKIVIYNASTSAPRFSATTTTAALNQPMWPSLSFPPLPLFPNHPNFPPFQGLYQRARIPFQQALHPSFGCYSKQGAPFSPQMFRSPYTPLLNYIPLVQPGFPHQRAPPQLPTSIQDLPAAHDGMRFPFPPPYGFGAAPGGAVRSTHHYPSNGSCVNF